MRAVGRTILATTLTIALWGVVEDTASAAPKKQAIVVRVVDQDGAPRASASVVACPVTGGQQDCSRAVGDTSNPDGYAHLKVDTSITYSVFSFVSNPQPPWACPGFVIGDQELYLSDHIDALGRDLPKAVTFTIAEPSPLDCVVVAVTDDAGNALPTAGLFVCAHAPGNTDCIGDRFEGPDGDGVIRMKIDAGLVYDLGTFIANSGWPCPGFTAEDGTKFHFGSSGSFTADDLLAGVSLVIAEPSPLDCVVVAVTDGAGNALPTAGLFVCAHAPGDTDCIGDRFEGPDGDGVIRMKIDAGLVYDLGTFIANSGWPCPGYIAEDGTKFHFGNSGSFTADDLLAGISLVIPVPELADCTPGTVTVTDDTGNLLVTAGLFVCAHAPGSPDCVGDRFDGADPDGIVRLTVDSSLVYDLRAFIADTGWPCPGFILDDGTPLWFGESGSFTADDLLAGITLVIHVPAPEECA